MYKGGHNGIIIMGGIMPDSGVDYDMRFPYICVYEKRMYTGSGDGSDRSSS